MSFSNGNDQAAGLRRMLEKRSQMRVVAFLSALPNRYKNAFFVNIVSALAERGFLTNVLDCSHQEGGIADYMGCHPKQYIFNERGQFTGIALHNYLANITVSRLSETTVNELANTPNLLNEMSDALTNSFADYKACLIDLQPENDNPLVLNIFNNTDIVVLTTPDPDCLKQAYLQIKQMYNQSGYGHFQLVVIDADNQQAKLVEQNLTHTCKIYLSLTLKKLGSLEPNRSFEISAQRGESLFEIFPGSNASAQFRKLANRLFISNLDEINPNCTEQLVSSPHDLVREDQNV